MTTLGKFSSCRCLLLRSVTTRSPSLGRSTSVLPVLQPPHYHPPPSQGCCFTNTADPRSSLGPNPGLESVIGQGMASLERTATEVQAKTKKVSSLTSEGKDKIQSHRQLAERQRILEVATECLEALCRRHPQNPLAVGGEPLTLLQVQVNSTARQAKVYWTLPYSVLMDERLTPTAYQTLMTRVEAQFDGNILQREVHTRLSFYFPPRLKFYPATPQMVAQAMEELL